MRGLGMHGLILIVLAATAAAAPGALEAQAFPEARMARVGANAALGGPPSDILSLQARLDVEGAPLGEALRSLEAGSGISVAYSPTVLPEGHRVTCRCRDATVGEAIGVILHGTNLGAVALGNHLIIRARVEEGLRTVPVARRPSPAEAFMGTGSAGTREPASPPRAQEGTITGTVTNSTSGQPIAGAQVTVTGTSRGTLSNDRGRFVIMNVPAGSHAVQAQFTGYGAQTRQVDVPAEGTVVVDFELTIQAITIDEIVVTGTAGERQRREVGNAITQINFDEQMELAQPTDVSAVLNRSPGVVVAPGSGIAGSGSRIRIRGRSSLTLDTQPLIYVDGVRIDNAVGTGPDIQGGRTTGRLSDINPEDIASVEVIKGPAASTLYGTEAASGVIQIFTKRGTPGEAPRVNVRVRQGATWFRNPEGRFPTNYWRNPEGQLLSINGAQSETDRGTPIFRTGRLQGYNASVSGGSDQLRYYISGDFDHEEGVEDPNVKRRISGRANLTAQVTDDLEIQSSLGVLTVRSDLVREDSPTSSVVGATLRATPRLVNEKERGFFARPPEVLWKTFDLNQDVDRFTGSIQMRHRPTDWLSQRLTLGADLVHENNVVLVPHLAPELARFYSDQFAQGFKDVNRRDVENLTVDYSVSGELQLSDEIQATTSAGLQYFRKFEQIFTANGEQFPAPGVKTVGSAAVRLGSDDFIENVTLGTFVQQELALWNRLFLTAAVRADDNSAFGRDFEAVVYPKFSASWVVSEESFFDVPGVDLFRVRGAFGASGQQPDAFASLRTYAPVTGTGDAPAATPQSIGNPELAPERGEEYEAGFEASLLGDRLGLDVTYYNQTTRNALLLADIPPSQGFPGQQWVNAGELNNNGIEALITGRLISRRNFAWDMGLNLSANNSEVVNLGGDAFVPLGVIRHVPGFEPASFFLKEVVSADLNAEGEAINVMCDGGTGPSGFEPGGPPTPCDDAPVVYQGHPEPDYQGNVTTSFTLFRDLTIHAMLEFQQGQTMWAEDNWVRCSIYRICLENFEPGQFDAKRIAEVERGVSLVRSIYFNDASWTKLRELAVSYRFPSSITSRINAGRASITMAGRNLYMWTDWTELDPEVARLSSSQLRIQQAQFPMLAHFTTTLSLTF